jgi:hypothetical protein
MKSKYWVLENRQPLWFSNKIDAGRVSANYQKIPEGMTAYHIEHGYPDVTRIAFHLDTWQRLCNIIKEIP